MFYDFLVVGQVVPVNPAVSVRGPKHIVKKGKTPIPSMDEARALLDTIPTDTVVQVKKSLNFDSHETVLSRMSNSQSIMRKYFF